MRLGGVTVTIYDTVRTGRSGSAARMPYRGTLQIHLLSVAKRIAALRASRARRMKVMILSGLQYLAAYVTTAISTLYTELFLIVLLAIRHAVSEKKKYKFDIETITECLNAI